MLEHVTQLMDKTQNNNDEDSVPKLKNVKINIKLKRPSQQTIKQLTENYHPMKTLLIELPKPP
jgi:hypothetical protein